MYSEYKILEYEVLVLYEYKLNITGNVYSCTTTAVSYCCVQDYAFDHNEVCP